jgi:copper resistance protein B
MRSALFAAALIATPAAAQEMDHSAHGAAQPAAMPAMDHSQHGDAQPTAMPEMDHSHHGDAQPAAPPASEPATAEPEVGNAPPPPIPTDHPADRFFPTARMEPARAALMHEGRMTTYAVKIDQFEYRAANGKDGYGWAGEAWLGGDIDKLVIASEGEGEFGHKPERAELHALWRHALDPFFNLELGARQDFRPDPRRTYAVIGIEGLAPYWFEVEAQAFVSNKGDVHLRAGASYDQRITQNLILQPQAELNVALQDVPELRIASGLERIELGARLRYEITPRFAPYLGVHWERKLGGTADLVRAGGEKPSGVAAVFGIKAWF